MTIASARRVVVARVPAVSNRTQPDISSSNCEAHAFITEITAYNIQWPLVFVDKQTAASEEHSVRETSFVFISVVRVSKRSIDVYVRSALFVSFSLTAGRRRSRKIEYTVCNVHGGECFTSTPVFVETISLVLGK